MIEKGKIVRIKRSFNFTVEQIEALEVVRRALSAKLGMPISSTAALHLCVQRAEDELSDKRQWRGKADQDGD